MKHSDFEIGLEFGTATGLWRCTDIGTRTIIAINVTDDSSWMNGPPYAVAERVFDEYDMDGCYTSLEQALIDGENSGEPQPLDMKKIIREAKAKVLKR